MTGADEALYAQAQRGDRAALAELAARYHAPLFRFLYRMTGSPQTAEDLCQDTFVRLMTFRGAPPQRFRAWAYTIACNRARDLFRSAAFRREQALPENGPYFSTLDPDAGAAADVQRALQSLSLEQRETVVLRFYDQCSLEEIAEVTGVPLGTVKSRLFHGLRSLKRALSKDEEVRDEPVRK